MNYRRHSDKPPGIFILIVMIVLGLIVKACSAILFADRRKKQSNHL